MIICDIDVEDRRFVLPKGAGSDAMHTAPQYAYAVCILKTNTQTQGVGLAFTLGPGNELVCQAIPYLAKKLIGQSIEEVMAKFGPIYRSMVDSPEYRWLGPHKGVVHLALAAVVNACYDLWAKARQVPLWKLLLDLSPEELVNTLDFTYLDEVLTRYQAIAMLEEQQATRNRRETVLQAGYRGYDTSVGWFGYSLDQLKVNIRKAMDQGFTAVKLKVGSDDPYHDVERANLVRETAGDDATIMLDANQKWTLPQALTNCQRLQAMKPYWIEEPTHPDDLFAHQVLAKQIAPMKIAAGEHVPNKVLFKNFLQNRSMAFCQVDAVRVGGISEFITISLLAKQFGIPVVPHVGDMGQIHQHLVLFNHIAVGHDNLFLEHIPHLRGYFQHPAQIVGGFYQVPQEIGSSSDLIH